MASTSAPRSAQEVLGAGAKFRVLQVPRISVRRARCRPPEKMRWKSYTIPEEAKAGSHSNHRTVRGSSGDRSWCRRLGIACRCDLPAWRYVLCGRPGGQLTPIRPRAPRYSFIAFDLKDSAMMLVVRARHHAQRCAFTVDCGLASMAQQTNCPQAKGPGSCRLRASSAALMLVDLPNWTPRADRGPGSQVVSARCRSRSRRRDPCGRRAIGKGSALGGVQWGTAFDEARACNAALSDVRPDTGARRHTRAQRSGIGGGAMRLSPPSAADCSRSIRQRQHHVEDAASRMRRQAWLQSPHSRPR
jgi:hypothetical protein